MKAQHDRSYLVLCIWGEGLAPRNSVILTGTDNRGIQFWEDQMMFQEELWIQIDLLPKEILNHIIPEGNKTKLAAELTLLKKVP